MLFVAPKMLRCEANNKVILGSAGSFRLLYYFLFDSPTGIKAEERAKNDSSRTKCLRTPVCTVRLEIGV